MDQKSTADYHAAEAILNSTRSAFFQPGTKFDRTFFEWCRTIEFGMVEIMSLFPKVKGKARIRYTCEVQCPRCNTWRVEECGRERMRQLISLVKSGADSRYGLRFYCAACEKVADEASKPASAPNHHDKSLLKLAANEAEKARRRTPEFIAVFLDPSRSWNAEISDENRFRRMTHEPVDSSMLFEAIRQMPLEVFVNTPYWIAVRGEALRRAGGKCSLCGTSGRLTIRFRQPGFQGSLHTEEGMREMLCLCERCKNTHVLISNFSN
jgi:hypothetical protein